MNVEHVVIVLFLAVSVDPTSGNTDDWNAKVEYFEKSRYSVSLTEKAWFRRRFAFGQ
ncbi:hypothetical protein DPMN_015101 [Dreissena polymorpha]|uniref:Uncharacterized protein n=1 Tax=Dreissena polymorpha TaxID=45954 RepID=A0A9D4NAV9_DREPO|nr:hypothetical protein DPMN_015101 [Dreissena polymorpha]